MLKELDPNTATESIMSLLEIGRKIRDIGPQIALDIYEAYREKFDGAQLKDQHAIKIQDDANQIICRQDWDYQTGKLDEKRQILVFIGPKTHDHEVLISYPRIRFFFEKNASGNWDFNGLQVGVRGGEFDVSNLEENKNSPDLETKVNACDLQRVLYPT